MKRPTAVAHQANPMTSPVILSLLLLLLLQLPSWSVRQVVEARATLAGPLASQAGSTSAASAATTTTTIAPTTFLEDPANSATSESSEDDTVCMKCYEQLKVAQGLIAVHENLVKKQNELIRRKQKAASSASTTIRNRTLNNLDNNTLIVVSRLRVARSTQSNGIEFGQAATGAAAAAGSTTPTSRTSTRSKCNKIDPALKQLKHKQVQQFNETCKGLHEVQYCLSEISRECLGNLQFHSYEVYSKQWLLRLNCPPSNDPGFKPFAGLTRSIPRLEDRERVPIPRSISSQEETQKKLDAIFGNRNMSPFGVMLKPTYTRSVHGRHLDGLGAVGSGHGGSVLENQLRVPMTSQLLMIPCFLVLMIALITLSVRWFKI